MDINCAIHALLDYGEREGLVKKEDRIYLTNSLLDLFKLSAIEESDVYYTGPLRPVLDSMLDYAYENGLIEENTISYRDLFDTKIMGVITPKPSEVIERFHRLYEKSPKEATDYFYSLAKRSDYIREDRIKKDLKWTVPSEFGDIDITVNLSKPEKDPKAIAAAKLLPQSGYPKCLLCHENEGYAGNLSKPARQTLRQIPVTMGGESFYVQYSPYVYYNEHCIALSARHTPMTINRDTFRKLLDFTEAFPHYFIGSNADLPIVGGSILSHDHYQGGCYTFPMERAEIDTPITFRDFPEVKCGIVNWPMSVIRLTAPCKSQLTSLAEEILNAWRKYSDPDSFIFAETDGERHNTVTPIARRRGEDYELDLVLRNNITTEEHPLGVFHPHSELHNIKRENIGLIEVMGLAVLPARLSSEIASMEKAILNGKDFATVKGLEKHSAWFGSFRDNYTFTESNTVKIIKDEIGKTFVKVLLDAGVFKRNESGKKAFLKFIDSVNS